MFDENHQCGFTTLLTTAMVPLSMSAAEKVNPAVKTMVMQTGHWTRR